MAVSKTQYMAGAVKKVQEAMAWVELIEGDGASKRKAMRESEAYKNLTAALAILQGKANSNTKPVEVVVTAPTVVAEKVIPAPVVVTEKVATVDTAMSRETAETVCSERVDRFSSYMPHTKSALVDAFLASGKSVGVWLKSVDVNEFVRLLPEPVSSVVETPVVVSEKVIARLRFREIQKKGSAWVREQGKLLGVVDFAKMNFMILCKIVCDSQK